MLAACATAPPDTGSLALTASGRLAVRVDATPERPAQSLTAAFEWRGSGERGELTLLSPLGSRIAQARWTPQGAWLTPDAQAQLGFAEALAERLRRTHSARGLARLAGRAALAGGGIGAVGCRREWGPPPASNNSAGALTSPASPMAVSKALRSAPPTVAVRIVLDKGDEAPARPAAGAATGAVTGAVTGAGASKP
ncbi:MAG: lipoprotein insertase outer membrane protein LolB [Rubrivivax sp.]